MSGKNSVEVGKCVLAVDPAFRNVGYVVVRLEGLNSILVDHGVIQTKKAKPKARIRRTNDDLRCVSEIAVAVNELIDKHSVVGILGESPGGSQHAASAKAAGLIIGTLGGLLASRASRIPDEWFSDLEVKSAMTGNKHASKQAMQQEAVKVFPELDAAYEARRESTSAWEGKFEHVADAVGVFIAGSKLGQLIPITRSSL